MGSILKRQGAPRGEAPAILKLRIDELRKELARKFSEHLPASGEWKFQVTSLMTRTNLACTNGNQFL
jgi:hypothetical protein